MATGIVVQHSSVNDDWVTPPEYVAAVHEVFGGPPDLDPASSQQHNIWLQAKRILTRGDGGRGLGSLEVDWAPVGESVWVNPPGGTTNNVPGQTSMTGLFWQKTLDYLYVFNDALFMGFTLELLRLSQRYGSRGAATFPHVLPRSRLRFWRYTRKGTFEPGRSPGHASTIVYLPGRLNRTEEFVRAFKHFGDVVVPR